MDWPTDWIAARTPPAPPELKVWLKIPDDGPESAGAGLPMSALLLRAGLVHLEEAEARPDRNREAAYQLLAADALITYACEAASEAADVGGVLREILHQVWLREDVE